LVITPVSGVLILLFGNCQLKDATDVKVKCARRARTSAAPAWPAHPAREYRNGISWPGCRSPPAGTSSDAAAPAGWRRTPVGASSVPDSPPQRLAFGRYLPCVFLIWNSGISLVVRALVIKTW